MNYLEPSNNQNGMTGWKDSQFLNPIIHQKTNIMKKMPDELKRYNGPDDEEENEEDGTTSPVAEEELSEA